MRTQPTALAFVLILIAGTGCSNFISSKTERVAWQPLFNGKDLAGFDSFINRAGKNVDPDGFFKVENGMIHILGFEPTEARKEFGYLRTIDTYGDYHFRVKYKWGTKKFPPRENQPRDSGVLYHMHNADKVWPDSIECQVQEKDTGEMIVVGNNLSTMVPVRMRGNQKVFDPNGAATEVTAGRVYKIPSPDSMTEWNTVEVITRGNSSVHIINGVVIMQVNDIMLRDSKQPVTSGHIVIQAEGAEIFYKDVEIRKLGADEKLPAPTPLPN